MIWYQWAIAIVLAWGVLIATLMRANYILSNRTRKRWNHGNRH